MINNKFSNQIYCCRIDEYNVKEVKESIFLVDARESQKALIALASCSQTCVSPQSTMPAPINSENVINIFSRLFIFHSKFLSFSK